ncbi:hypothetical protein KIH39_05010 [Telmatocola sphagniphila]|uniref:HEAT repeat domain-containing protein n=1 Tax=Telmatocola sphagniphila TaxID=1123043 RepID=A0A8E6B8L1_9BACT|nr:hypothetical protein [Telmatocola sphagniphila]QVL33279.1 hypothetical protein KIH39_05010 [Telmatocola sphagniphila]
MRKAFIAVRCQFAPSIAVVGALSLLTAGCGLTGDQITSKRFRDEPFKMTFGQREEPMSVLTRDNAEGDERIDAMQRLQEPMSRGGSKTEQDTAIRILTEIATSDPQGMCRLAAVEALGRFQDPRAGVALMQAYQNAPINTLNGTHIVLQAAYNPTTPGARQAGNFTLDMIARIQEQTMESIGKCKSPEGKALLIETAMRSTKKTEQKEELTFNSSYDAEHYRFDIRLAAIHALRNYVGDMQVAKTLIEILQSEREIAVQHRCIEALKAVTNQDHGNVPQAWIDSWKTSSAAMAAGAGARK